MAPHAIWIYTPDGTRLGAGKRLVIAVGPDCGIGGAIADELYRGVA